MGRALCLSLALLFLANVISSKAQNAEAGVSGEAAETRVTVAAGAPLALECRLRPEQRAEWRRDGGALPADLRVEPEQPAPDGRLAARLRAAAARPRHAGLYTCSRERDQRVRLLVQEAPAAPAATAATAASPAGEAGGEAGEATTEAARAGGAPELLYDVRGNITLRCTLPNDNAREYIWKKNDTLVDELWDLKDRFKLEHGSAEFKIERSHEDDFGNYSCALSGAAAEQRWAVRGRPHVKLPANSNVVEGQKLKLVCKVIGKPYPEVTWAFSNSTDEAGNFTDVAEALGGRAQLARSEQGVPNGALVLEAAARADAGRFRCGAAHAPAPAVTRLRVKDMYAALWPFLGICAEVFILCAIILVYEKRRTKPELDDSDTDNHDQKKS